MTTCLVGKSMNRKTSSIENTHTNSFRRDEKLFRVDKLFYKQNGQVQALPAIFFIIIIEVHLYPCL